MARNIFPIIKNPHDHSRYLPKINSLMYGPASVVVDIRGSSESVLTSGSKQSYIIRPDSIYTERLLQILLGPNTRVLSTVHRLLIKDPFTLPSADRPRILKMLTDAELLAYSLSTHHVNIIRTGSKEKKIHIMKDSIDADRAVYSVELARRKFKRKHIVVVPTTNSLPAVLQGRHDLIYIDIPLLTSSFSTGYLDKLTRLSKRFMVVCTNIETMRILQRYMHDEITDGSGKNPVYVVRNYNI